MSAPAVDWAATFTRAVMAYRRRCNAAGEAFGNPSPDTSGYKGFFVLRDDAGAELDRFEVDGLGKLGALHHG